MNGLFTNDCCCKNPCDPGYHNCCGNAGDNWMVIVAIIAVIFLLFFND